MEYTVDVSKPVKNPLLVEMLDRMRREKTKETSELVIDQIIQAKFLIPIVLDKEPIENADGTVTFQTETSLSFPLLVNAKKQRYFMAFTDWDELHKWSRQENQKTAVFTLQDYVELLTGKNNEGASGFVINPFGGNLTLTTEMALAIAKQGKQHYFGK